MRCAVEPDHARLMDHLLQHHEGIAGLIDLEIVVVAAGKLWRAARDAAFGEIAIGPGVRRIGSTPPAIFGAGLFPLLRLRSQWWKAAIRGIDDERRMQQRMPALAP